MRATSTDQRADLWEISKSCRQHLAYVLLSYNRLIDRAVLLLNSQLGALKGQH